MTDPTPLSFRPIFKRTIWGGRQLGDQLNKPIGSEKDYAESWEVVDHGQDQSVVVGGELDGKTLKELLRDDPTWLMGKSWGERPKTSMGSQSRFPLLLKYLDCNRVLSVQVHPDDAYGLAMDPPDLGKTEAWYVVSSEPDSLIYAGLKEGVDRATLAEAVEVGQTEQVLHQFHPEPGDCVFIPAGTVHALGAGLVIAEIQQSSDTTFRLFDWNRQDAQGNSRPLHIEPSLEVTDYQRGPVHPRRTDRASEGWQTLVACDKFVLRSLCMGEGTIGGDDRFHIVTVPEGTATLQLSTGDRILTTGQTVLIPAAMSDVNIVPSVDAVVLAMRLPDEAA